MTYALRAAVLCDDRPAVINGKSIRDYSVLMADGTIRANVTPDRLRPRPAVMEIAR